jgi:hypothetical protein
MRGGKIAAAGMNCRKFFEPTARRPAFSLIPPPLRHCCVMKNSGLL